MTFLHIKLSFKWKICFANSYTSQIGEIQDMSRNDLAI